MAQKIRTFLMFEGKAEEALTFYVSLFADSRVIDIKRYGPQGPGKPGTVYQAVIVLAGQEFMFIDSAVKHAFGFTPAISLFVTCETADEIKTLAGKLGEGGMLLMPLDKYPFAEKFVWVSDRFGVSWQLIFNAV
ncbi:MAG TPA: VOC family protein [Reyranellaceae bacterium]|nr:VOC family protein [Reyranellaceae bacterium]